MSSRSSILIVDDDEIIRRTLAMILEEKGYSVDTAKTGEEAIQKSRTNFYNLALIDIRLPDMSGTRLLTEMKDTLPRMVKIIMTGYPTLENAIEAVNRGADGYVIKPVNIDELLKKIEEHLERQRREMKYSEEKVAEFIESRVKELEQRQKRERRRKERGLAE